MDNKSYLARRNIDSTCVAIDDDLNSGILLHKLYIHGAELSTFAAT